MGSCHSNHPVTLQKLIQELSPFYHTDSGSAGEPSFIAGSGTQCSNLTSDMWYGRRYAVPSRWQFWAQAAMVLSCSVVSALTFSMIHRSTPLTFESEALAAPAAKMWAVIGLLFDPGTAQRLPPFAVQSMWIGGAVGLHGYVHAFPAA